jgi:hypothetical protein
MENDVVVDAAQQRNEYNCLKKNLNNNMFNVLNLQICMNDIWKQTWIAALEVYNSQYPT